MPGWLFSKSFSFGKERNLQSQNNHLIQTGVLRFAGCNRPSKMLESCDTIFSSGEKLLVMLKVRVR